MVTIDVYGETHGAYAWGHASNVTRWGLFCHAVTQHCEISNVSKNVTCCIALAVCAQRKIGKIFEVGMGQVKEPLRYPFSCYA